MITKFKKLYTNPFVLGSAVMIIGSNVTNFLNYSYHLLMGRLLADPSKYGELASLITLLGFISLIPTFLGFVIIKFISSSKSEDEVKNLAYWLNKKSLYLSILSFLVIFTLSGALANYLHVNQPILIILIGAVFLFSLQSFLYKSILQGLLKFNENVVSLLSENLAKLLLGVILVYLGFSVFGAVIGILISSFIGWAVSRRYIQYYLVENIKYKVSINNLIYYSFPVFIQSLASISLYSSDLILVKHFFSSFDAGLYAALSTLSRIIFFATGPILGVMFPLVSKKQVAGENYNRIFLSSLLLASLASLGILIIYYFFPELMISLLYGNKYLAASQMLFKFGLFLTFFTIGNLFAMFFLSLGKIKITYLQFIAAMIQIIAINFFHESLEQVITISMMVSMLLLAIFVLFYLIDTLKEKQFN